MWGSVGLGGAALADGDQEMAPKEYLTDLSIFSLAAVAAEKPKRLPSHITDLDSLLSLARPKIS